jgi:hypothetical protein
MRYSVRATFHVDATTEALAEAAVESALDLLFGVHWRDLQVPGAYIHNAVVLHSHTTGSEADH